MKPELVKEAWLGELKKFLIEANANAWAADDGEAVPQRPGYQEPEFPKNGWGKRWYLRDSYTGYFQAPGTSTVYYRKKPAWVMQYGGAGQTPEFFDEAKPTYNFLREALKHPIPDLPFRGPEDFYQDEYRYQFKMLEGNIEEGLWKEKVSKNGLVVFQQTGLVGLVIHRNQDRKPVYPWD